MSSEPPERSPEAPALEPSPEQGAREARAEGRAPATPAAGCALIVESCDARADLWGPCLGLLDRFWSDRPFETLLLTEVAEPTFPGVRALPTGLGTPWSTQVLQALDAVSAPYVIRMHDDFFLHAPVDTQRVLRLLDWVREADANMLRLTPKPGPDSPVPGAPEVGEIHRRAGFRASNQISIWKVEFLRELLQPEESPWEFERLGSERARAYPGLYALWEPALHYEEVVVQGQWWRHQAPRYAALDVGCDFETRPLAGRGVHLARRLKRGVVDLGDRLSRAHLSEERRYRLLEFMRRRGMRV